MLGFGILSSTNIRPAVVAFTVGDPMTAADAVIKTAAIRAVIGRFNM